jgi:DNA polymerase-1
VKRVIIIDALNMMLRSYIFNPSLSANGQPIGGMKGFLQSLQKHCREIRPDAVVIAWDGQGGSNRRRQMNKNYKKGRKPIRLNRDIRNLSESEEMSNKIWQQTRLVEYLNALPVTQIMLPLVEADDIIAQVAKMSTLGDWQKIVISADKDFIQICDDTTILLRPIQKQILNSKRIVEEYGIHPNNFALARAVVGDKSDNLEGIRGVGLGTISKRFPFMANPESVTIDEFYKACESTEKKLKVHNSILDGRDVVESNYKIMQLYSPAISPQGKEKIRYAVEENEFDFNKTMVQKMMIEDGFGATDWSDLFQTMKRISLDNKA